MGGRSMSVAAAEPAAEPAAVASSAGPLHRVVIVGGGFGGLYAAKGLAGATGWT